MKLIYLGCTFAIIYYMRFKFKHSYDKEHDTFRLLFLVVPCFLCALVINAEFSVYEVSHCFQLIWSVKWNPIIDSVDILHLLRSSSHSPTIVFVAENGRSREHHLRLHLYVGLVQSALFTQLDLQILHWTWLLSMVSLDCRSDTNRTLLRLLLLLHHQVRIQCFMSFAKCWFFVSKYYGKSLTLPT